MSEAPRDSAEIEPAGPEKPVPAVTPSLRIRGRRRRAIRRWVWRGTVALASVLAALIFTLFTVDIGDISVGGRSLRTLAEGRGSKFLERPLHIERIRAHLTPGKFVLENVVIEGPTPQDRPFFSAGKITVDLPWWTLFNQRQLYIEVRLEAWRMVVEKFPDGKAHLPQLTSKNKDGKGFPLKIRGLAVYGHGGEFIYEDHTAPWQVIGRNLNFNLVRANNVNSYVGGAEFTGGTVQIHQYEPMRTDFRTQFQVDGGVVRLRHLDLITDGSESHIGGFVNFGRWPEQEYRIQSTVDFNRMREVFFTSAPFRMAGLGRFNGVFKIFKDGFDLSGLFNSDEAELGIGKTEWRFPNLNGALEWTPTGFRVSRADSDFLGGRMTLAYGMPLGNVTSSPVTFTADYNDVDLYRFTRQFGWTALEPRGRMHGHLAMAWPKGVPFTEGMQGTGNTVISPPAGQPLAAATLPASAEPIPAEKPFQPFRPMGEFALGGTTAYRFTASSLDFDPSWVATPTTYVKFQGRARGGPADLAFHVTSHDWQNSDRLFAAIMSNFRGPMGGIDVGGRGVFDGKLTKQFNAPRIEGRFVADDMRAFGEVWGHATGDIVVENSYLTVTDGRVEDANGGRIVTSGTYALGYPRADRGEEINAKIHVENMTLPPLLRAFKIQDWPITGVLAAADLHLTGQYEAPGGTGELRLEKATAWGEPFESAAATLAFEGDGSMRVSRIELAKSTARIKGDAWLSWALGAYSFTARASPADGGGLPVEELTTFKFERAPLTGILSFRASGAGTFDSPSWRVDDGRIPDLYIGDEAIGAIGIRLSLTNNVLTVEEIAAEHDRLHLACNGTIATDATSQAALRCNFTNASLDPYLKFVARELPFTRAIMTGSVNVDGPLRDLPRLNVDVRVDEALITLFQYKITNDGPLLVAFRNNTFRVGTCGLTPVPGCQRLQFKGEGTSLAIGGVADVNARTVNLSATGQASPAILQAFYPLLSASGDAKLQASLTGTFDKPTLLGSADITNGAMRHFDVTHGITEINGRITMEEGRISVKGVRAVIGEGAVELDGFIALDGYRPDVFNVDVRGRSMHLRVPEGLHSTVDTDLYLRGPITAPVLSGTVDVQRASYSLGVDSQTAYLGLLTAGNSTAGETGAAVAPDAPSAFPLRLDIKINAPTMPFVENRTASAVIYGSADVAIRGTINKPIITGRVEIDRGEWVFSGNRYQLLGGSIDFTNPNQFEPFFEIRAETRVPTPGQAYMVSIRVTGTLDKLKPTLNAEPWLPEFQIWSLLLGEMPDVGEAELRARSAPQELQAQALRSAAFMVIASPVSATLGSALQRMTTLDTVQIAPLLGSQSSVTPSARITLAKRISERVYMMYARTLSAEQNEVIMVMFDQNERLSWVLSRNEDRTFALDFRLRFVFR